MTTQCVLNIYLLNSQHYLIGSSTDVSLQLNHSLTAVYNLKVCLLYADRKDTLTLKLDIGSIVEVAPAGLLDHCTWLHCTKILGKSVRRIL